MAGFRRDVMWCEMANKLISKETCNNSFNSTPTPISIFSRQKFNVRDATNFTSDINVPCMGNLLKCMAPITNVSNWFTEEFLFLCRVKLLVVNLVF